MPIRMGAGVGFIAYGSRGERVTLLRTCSFLTCGDGYIVHGSSFYLVPQGISLAMGNHPGQPTPRSLSMYRSLINTGIALALMTIGLAVGTPVAFAMYHGCMAAYGAYRRVWP